MDSLPPLPLSPSLSSPAVVVLLCKRTASHCCISLPLCLRTFSSARWHSAQPKSARDLMTPLTSKKFSTHTRARLSPPTFPPLSGMILRYVPHDYSQGPQWDWVPVAHSGSPLLHIPLIVFFSVSLSPLFTYAYWNHN